MFFALSKIDFFFALLEKQLLWYGLWDGTIPIDIEPDFCDLFFCELGLLLKLNASYPFLMILLNVKLNSLYVEGRLNNFKEVYSVQKIFIWWAKKQYFHWFDGIIIH